MTPKRKQTQEYILSYMKKIFKKDNNYNLYKNLFDKMNDQEFDEFMQGLRDGTITLSCVISTNDSDEVDPKRNISIGKELGFNFFQKIRVSGSDNLPDYTTPNEYLVLKLPIRRAAQLLVKKISLPEDDNTIDNLTGQVTNKSKGSKISLPEIQVLAGIGMKEALNELVKIRGGDLGSARALKGYLERGLPATQKEINLYSTGVESTKTLNSYLNGMHIKSNINKI